MPQSFHGVAPPAKVTWATPPVEAAAAERTTVAITCKSVGRSCLIGTAGEESGDDHDDDDDDDGRGGHRTPKEEEAATTNDAK